MFRSLPRPHLQIDTKMIWKQPINPSLFNDPSIPPLSPSALFPDVGRKGEARIGVRRQLWDKSMTRSTLEVHTCIIIYVCCILLIVFKKPSRLARFSPRSPSFCRRQTYAGYLPASGPQDYCLVIPFFSPCEIFNACVCRLQPCFMSHLEKVKNICQ